MRDIIFAFLIGLTSAFVYSFIQGALSYFRWLKTKRFFTNEIRAEMLYVNYNLMTILDIDPIYPTEYEDDHLMSDEEFIFEVRSLSITKEQYKKINRMLNNIRKKTEELRKDALTIPIYSSLDFHATDSFLNGIGNFLSSYYWLEESLDERGVADRLKDKLISIIQCSNENPFPRGFLDNLFNWYTRNRIKIKNMEKKYDNNGQFPF